MAEPSGETVFFEDRRAMNYGYAMSALSPTCEDCAESLAVSQLISYMLSDSLTEYKGYTTVLASAIAARLRSEHPTVDRLYALSGLQTIKLETYVHGVSWQVWNPHDRRMVFLFFPSLDAFGKGFEMHSFSEI